jgi:hypothetical protein
MYYMNPQKMFVEKRESLEFLHFRNPFAAPCFSWLPATVTSTAKEKNTGIEETAVYTRSS